MGEFEEREVVVEAKSSGWSTGSGSGSWQSWEASDD